MANNDIEIKVLVDAKGAVTALNDVGEEIKRVESATEQGASGFSKFQAAIVTLNQGIGLAKTAFSAMTGAAGAVFEQLERGSAVGDIAESFKTLSDRAGAVSDVFLGELEDATAGTISKFDLMRKSNELLNAGLKPDAIVTFSKAARAFGEQDGKSFEETLQGITDSVLRGNDRFLKSKGIILDLTKAFDDYAFKMGKTTAEITESEKAEIARTKTLEALQKKLGEIGEVSVDAGDAIAQVRKVFVDAFDDIRTAIAGDQGTIAALKEFAGFLRDTMPTVVKGTVGLLTQLIKEIDGVFAATKRGQLEAVNDKIRELENRMKAIKEFGSDGVIARYLGQDATTQLNQVTLELLLMEDIKNKLTRTTADLTDATNAGALAVNGEAGALIKLNTTGGDAGRTLRELAKAQEEAAKKAFEHEMQMIELNGSIEDLARLEKELGREGFLDALFGKPSSGAGGSSSLLDGFGQALLGNFADVIGQVASSIQSGNFGRDDVGKIFGGYFSNAVSKGIGNAVANDLISEELGAVLGPLGALGGELIGSTLGKGLYSGISRIFGAGRDDETEARKEADKFFADLFNANRLSVIIDGQLTQIKDLVFGNDSQIFEDGSFDDSFHSLEDSARQAFAGVGLAFEDLVGGMGEQSGQLAAVIVNNIGGSLNNLQLFVQATGKSFEDLRGTIVEAFLDGKISALEAQSALLGIQQIAQKGIPDGIGFTVQAFENMVAAGSKGGRAVVDALGDIGAEAAELNIKTFPELMANLAASGKFTQQQIEQVFNALAANGIDSVEELTNATAEQLIPVLSQLQAEGFLTEAAQEVSDIVTTLERLPTRKDVEINLRVNASQADRTILNQVSGGQLGGGGQGLGFTQ